MDADRPSEPAHELQREADKLLAARVRRAAVFLLTLASCLSSAVVAQVDDVAATGAWSRVPYIYLGAPLFACIALAAVAPHGLPASMTKYLVWSLVPVAFFTLRTASMRFADSAGASSAERALRLFVSLTPLAVSAWGAWVCWRTRSSDWWWACLSAIRACALVRLAGTLLLYLYFPRLPTSVYPPGFSFAVSLQVNAYTIIICTVFTLRLRLSIASMVGSSAWVRLSDLALSDGSGSRGGSGGRAAQRQLERRRPSGVLRSHDATSEERRDEDYRSYRSNDEASNSRDGYSEMSISRRRPGDTGMHRQERQQRLESGVNWETSFPSLSGAPFRPNASLTSHEAAFKVDGVSYRLLVDGPFSSAFRKDVYTFTPGAEIALRGRLVAPTHMELVSDGRVVKTQLYVRHAADGRGEQVPVHASMTSYAPPI